MDQIDELIAYAKTLRQAIDFNNGWTKVPNPSIADYPLPWTVGEAHETMARVCDANKQLVFTVNTSPFNHLAGEIAAAVVKAMNATPEQP